ESCHGPAWEHRPDQLRQKDSVFSKTTLASIAGGVGRCDGPCVKTKGVHSPSATSNSATVAKSFPCNGTGVRSTTWFAPAMALRPDPWGSCVPQGTVVP